MAAMASEVELRMKLLARLLSGQIFSYLFFGAITTVVALGLYFALFLAGFGTVAANTVSTAAAVLLAFVTNKIFVFASRDWNPGNVAKELAKFSGWRVATYAGETLALLLLVDFLGFHGMAMKTLTVALVVIANYCISRWLVFNKKTG